jgi:mannose-6-phosphate isomerase
MSTAPVFKIVPGLQSYAWGKKGSSSLAAQLGSRSIPDYEIDDEKPYAEVCLGLQLSLVTLVGHPMRFL